MRPGRPLDGTLPRMKVPQEDLDAIRELAGEHDRTFAGEIRRAIKVYLMYQNQAKRRQTPHLSAQNGE